MMTGFRLDQVDTWFFRDGSPFTAEATAQDGVAGLFPPHPPTVVGALRAALARENGWNGGGSWTDAKKIVSTLGDGPDDLGKVSFDGPFLLRNGKPLFRAPRHLLGKKDGDSWTPTEFLRPGEPVECDLGNVRLPALREKAEDPETLKPGDDYWLTASGMTAALNGDDKPGAEDVVHNRSLWASEHRIGLERCNKKRTAKEGMLYSAKHTRVQEGVSLGARVRGLPDDWARPTGQMTPLGGESRLAECAEWNGELGITPPIDAIGDSKQIVLVALTPLDINRKVYTGEKRIEELGGARVVSACLDRPQRIGGWDSQKRRPIEIRSVLPPGSVLFCELEAPDIPVEDGGLARIGRRKEWGFGLVALGVWPKCK